MSDIPASMLTRLLLVCSAVPKYFKQTRYKSFQRQLHIWGFKRVTSGHEKNAVHHEHFRRGYPELCNHMTRVKIKGETTRPAGWLTPQIMNTRRGSLESTASSSSDTPPVTRSSDYPSFGSQTSSLDHLALSAPSSIVMGGLSNSTSSLGTTLSHTEQQLLLAYRQLNSPSFVPYPAEAVSSVRHAGMAGPRFVFSSFRQANQGVPPDLLVSSFRQANQGVPPDLLGSNRTNPAAVVRPVPNPPPFCSTIEQEELLRRQVLERISMTLLLRR
jgi:hypothetical protein